MIRSVDDRHDAIIDFGHGLPVGRVEGQGEHPVESRHVLDEIGAAEDDIGPATEEREAPAHGLLVAVLLADGNVAVGVPGSALTCRRSDAGVAAVGRDDDALAGQAQQRQLQREARASQQSAVEQAAEVVVTDPGPQEGSVRDEPAHARELARAVEAHVEVAALVDAVDLIDDRVRAVAVDTLGPRGVAVADDGLRSPEHIGQAPRAPPARASYARDRHDDERVGHGRDPAGRGVRTEPPECAEPFSHAAGRDGTMRRCSRVPVRDDDPAR